MAVFTPVEIGVKTSYGGRHGVRGGDPILSACVALTTQET